MRERIELNEKISLAIAGFVAVGMFLLSIYSLFKDIFISFSAPGILLDIAFIFLSLYLGSGILKTYNRITYSAAIDREFREALLKRLEPALKEVAKSHVYLQELDKKVTLLSKRVSTISAAYPARPARAAPGEFSPFFQRAVFMSLLTLGSLIFVNLRISQTGAYVVLVLFFLWWLIITDEFGLFADFGAYMFIIGPLLVVPIASIILLAYLDVFYMLMILYLALVIYVLLYYSAASYQVTGRIPLLERSNYNMYRNGGAKGANARERDGGSLINDNGRKPSFTRRVVELLLERLKHG
jgi:hypothetical protein